MYRHKTDKKKTQRGKWTCRTCESAAGRRPRTACWLTAGGTLPSGTAPADTAAWRRPPLSGSTPRTQLEEETHECYRNIWKPFINRTWIMQCHHISMIPHYQHDTCTTNWFHVLFISLFDNRKEILMNALVSDVERVRRLKIVSCSHSLLWDFFFFFFNLKKSLVLEFLLFIYYLTPPRRSWFWFCLLVCLSDCQQDCRKTTVLIFMKPGDKV